MKPIALALLVVLAGLITATANAHPPTTRLDCGDARYDFAQKPTFCSTRRPGDRTLYQSIAIHGLNWSHWGRSSSTAVGRTRSKDYEPWDTVRVRAYRRVWSECVESYVYTRLRTTSKRRGRTVWKMPDCA